MKNTIDCKKFEYIVADWITGRLNLSQAELMVQHENSCSKCAGLAQVERNFSYAVDAMPDLNRTPDLWERIENRIQNVPVKSGFRFALNRLYAFGGVLAAACVLSVFVVNRPMVVSPDSGSNVINAAQERQVVQLAADIHYTNETESEGQINSFPHAGADAERILVGPNGGK